MRLLVVGVSHKTADVAVRERLAVDAGGTGTALRALADRFGEAELALLSTCNRTELYCARPVHGHPREPELLDALGRGAVDPHVYERCAYTLTDAEAIRHLFRVAAGLDSMVLGECQVLGQVRQAYQLAAEAGTVGPQLDALFRAALATAKAVQSRTDIAAGRVSVAGVAIDAAREALGDLAGASVLSVGAGKMNLLMLRRLHELGAARFAILNRTPERAERIAAPAGAEAGSLGELPARLADADVVVCSTGSPEPLVTRAMVEHAMLARPDRPLLLMDIAVPRDVAPAVRGLPGVRLYDLDDLDAVVRSSFRTRASEVSRCDAIVEEQVAAFQAWLSARQVAPTIKALRRRLREIADDELAAAERKFSTHGDAAEDHAILRRAMHRLVQRILHAPTGNLRSEGHTEAARVHAAALRRLFDLDDEA